MRKVFLDTETCGFHGVPVIMQYAFDNEEEIRIHNFWSRPVQESLDLIDEILKCQVVGFNLAFDWFHIVKITLMLRLLKEHVGHNAATWEFPDEHIPLMEKLEKEAIDGPCIKPLSCLDLMLHARKGEFQITMNRDPIRIRAVPTELAWSLAAILEEKVQLPEILFAKGKNKIKWKVFPRVNTTKFMDIVLKFKPSVSLKSLMSHVLGKSTIAFNDIQVDKAWLPKELGWAPYAEAVRRHKFKKGNKQYGRIGPWPDVIKHHIQHWDYHETARQYARDDVHYTRTLYHYFDSPAGDDDDSILACCIAAVRWKGYNINVEKMQALRDECVKIASSTPTSPGKVKIWIGQVLSEEEKAVFSSTNKKALDDLMKQDDLCPFGPCPGCNNTGSVGKSEAATRAAMVMEARAMKEEIKLYEKLILARKFHASFKAIGTKSTRMSGDNGLNAQGVKRTKKVRELFTFGENTCGGDFEGFEVVLAEAAYNEPALRHDLLTCEKCRNDTIVNYIEGKRVCPKCGGSSTMKIHAIFGTFVFPPLNYDQIKATSGTPDDKYNRSKSAVFAKIFGGTAYTLMTRLLVPIAIAEKANAQFEKRYPGVGVARVRMETKFCTLKQAGGLGSKIEYTPADDSVASLFGFQRFFTLENKIVDSLIAIANDLPEEWQKLKGIVRRRQRNQTVCGAVQSALYGTAFNIQSSNMRAGANHEIQSSGAEITKKLERNIWDIQPSGIHEWYVQPCNIHDEIISPVNPIVEKQVEKVVNSTVESFRQRVPLIEFEWKHMASWAEK